MFYLGILFDKLKINSVKKRKLLLINNYFFRYLFLFSTVTFILQLKNKNKKLLFYYLNLIHSNYVLKFNHLNKML